MNNKDFLAQLYRSFAQFVPKEVIGKNFVASDQASMPGANELFTELMNLPNDKVYADIDTFLVSTDESVVSDRVKNSNNITLFVEYGEADFTPVADGGYIQDIAIVIAKDYTSKNSDNLNSVLSDDLCHNMLIEILTQLKKETDLQCSACGKWIFPANINPINPKEFYGKSGYAAYIKLSKTYM